MDLYYKVKDNKYKNIRDVLKGHFLISTNLLTALKKNNKIFYNGINTYLDHDVDIGDEIVVNLDFYEDSENIVPANLPLDIIFEDESMIIVNKPSNTPVHPSMLHYENTLSNAVKNYFNNKNIHSKIRPVNRLDKDTTGLVIFAKNQYVQELLIKQMKNDSLKKYYLAILEGHLENKTGTINAPISRKDNSIIEREINESGAEAISYYKLIKNYNSNGLDVCLVEFTLKTGRTHQLRVHSKYIGHPILGDTLYGTKSNLISRQALHAYKLEFKHPINNKPMKIEIDLPNDMKKI